MKVLDEINHMVKSAQLGALGGARSYFSGQSSVDPDLAAYSRVKRTKFPSPSTMTPQQFVNFSQNRQWVPRMNRRPRVQGGNEVRIGGAAPVSQVAQSDIRPYQYRSNGGKGGVLGMDANGNWTPWSQTRSAGIMAAANKGQTPSSMIAARRNAEKANRGKFDFRGEAVKLLKSYGANASKANGQYSTDIGKSMISQWKDMQANPQNYDEAKQRQILDQWKNNIAKMNNRSSTGNVASVAKPNASGTQTVSRTPDGITLTRRSWHGIPGGSGQPQWVGDSLAKINAARNRKLQRNGISN